MNRCVVRHLLRAAAGCVAGATLLCSSLSAQSYATWTSANSVTAFNAYSTAFYFNSYAKLGGSLIDGHGFLTHEGSYSSSSNPQTGFWNWAEQIEMTEDAYNNAVATGNSTQASTDEGMITQLCDGFIDEYGDSWSSADSYNDDLEWATIAFDRAYEITANTRYHTDATNNLGAVWSRGQESYGGYTGLWEDVSNKNKLSAVANFTFVIAAELLRKDETQASGWQSEANTIWAFAINELYNSSKGQIYDGLDLSNGTWTINKADNSYNYGVAIGAAVYEETWNAGGTGPVGGYNAQAQSMATYLATKLSTSVNPSGTAANNCSGSTPSDYGYYGENAAGFSKVLPIYCSFGKDSAGFNGIALRWVGFALGLSTFNDSNATLDWAQKNVSQAWAGAYTGSQTNSQYLSWNDWIDPTPASTGSAPLYSWDCSDLVVGMMDIPIT